MTSSGDLIYSHVSEMAAHRTDTHTQIDTDLGDDDNAAWSQLWIIAYDHIEMKCHFWSERERRKATRGEKIAFAQKTSKCLASFEAMQCGSFVVRMGMAAEARSDFVFSKYSCRTRNENKMINNLRIDSLFAFGSTRRQSSSLWIRSKR